jgi:exodeoxyribonuclease V alpha subunit
MELLRENFPTDSFIDTDDERIKTLLSRKYTILSGTAGTGKTTLLRKIAGFSNRILLSGTTGKAAKQLGNDAVTVHSLLGFRGCKFTVKNLDCDLLIVDEASMLNWATLYAILQAAPRVIFAGDPGQLPPVEGESVFKEMIELLPVVMLENVHRYNPVSHVKEIPVQNEWDAVNTIKKIALFFQKRGDEFQVITPVHSGLLGTRQLNIMLQNTLNPDEGASLRIGDKVIVTKNIYVDGELLASNGQGGVVEKKEDDDCAIVKTGGEKILFKKDEIELAYALTVHKFQGSEADYVIFVVPFNMEKEFLTEELLFTGKTRGRKKTFMLRQEEKYGNIYEEI